MNGDEIGSVFRDARADELVGSRQPAGPRRFGALIGALRMAHGKRDLERLRSRGATRPPAGRENWTDLNADDDAGDLVETTNDTVPGHGTGGAR
jgi:hypothetical protein